MDRKMNVDPIMNEDTHEAMDPGMHEAMDPGMHEAMDQPGMDESRAADMHVSMDHATGTDTDETMGHTNRQRKWGWFRRKSRRA